MNKRSILGISLILTLAAAFLPAQGLLVENEYLAKARELKAKALAAFEDGDYVIAEQLVAEAEVYMAKSDDFVIVTVKTVDLTRKISALEADLAAAERKNARVNFPDEFARAKDAIGKATVAVGAKDFDAADSAIAKAQASFQTLLTPLPFPQFYVVRYIPERRDCFWRIAELPAVYDDPYLWPKLYEANKGVIQDPKNPDLIQPKQVFTIPSLWGEERSGYFDPNKIYPKLPKPTK
jgi:nucleoid-associated protein YgaU